ncbi:MAG: tyrosinase family protein [Pseudomonadota bacterium]
MQKFSRRAALGMASASVMGFTASRLSDWAANAQAARPKQRFDVASPEGKDMLRVYADGVGQMKALPSTHPHSWKFQWFTHWVDGNSTKAQELQAYQNDPTYKMLAIDMWDTCRGHDHWIGEQQWFCPWHRMYLLYFEEIIRQLTGNGDFTLPYWDYTTAGKDILPEEFRMENDATFGPLFEPKRYADINTGDALRDSPLYSRLWDSFDRDPLGLQCMDVKSYLDTGFRQGFNSMMDQTPHGAVHVLVGNTENMGRIPYAAGDPIFWIHHCNVDRIWSSWLAAGDGRTNPDQDAWQYKSFTFVNQFEQSVLDITQRVVETEPLGYVYAELLDPPTPPDIQISSLDATVTLAQAEVTPRAGAVMSFSLGAEASTATVELPEESFEASSADGTGSERLFLVLRNFRAAGAPGVFYEVYLGDAATAEAQDADRLVGVIDFFDAMSPETVVPSGQGKFRSFDITELYQSLQASGALDAAPEVTIVPVGAPAEGAAPTIEEVFFAFQ